MDNGLLTVTSGRSDERELADDATLGVRHRRYVSCGSTAEQLDTMSNRLEDP